MNHKILTSILIISAISCTGNNEAKLESLKKKQVLLAEKIESLEREISAGNEPSAADAATTFVSVETMQQQPFNHYIEVLGKLDGDENVAVYPESIGIIEEIFVRTGERVKAGQVLASLDDDAYQGQLESLESNLELATKTFAKQQTLWEQKIGSEIQYLQAKTTKESLEAQVTGLKTQIDMMLIKSPVAGTVEESSVKVGQAVSSAMPAFRVVSFNHLKVTAEVAEAYTAKVNPGDEVYVYLPDIDLEIAAKVSFCSRYISPVNRTFEVEAQLNANSDKLKANMVAVMKINDYEVLSTYVLPINLVQNGSEGNFVFLAQMEGNQYVARKRNIQVGQIYDGLAEITEGLDSGSTVITSGYLSLNEGQPIRF